MLKITTRVENLDGFDAQFDEVVKAIEHNLDDVATHVEIEAQTTSAFVDKTGNLRKSIKKRKSKFEGGGYIVLAKAPHAPLIEFGHVMIAWGRPTGRRVPPHPFMRPALEKGLHKAVSLFRGNNP